MYLLFTEKTINSYVHARRNKSNDQKNYKADQGDAFCWIGNFFFSSGSDWQFHNLCFVYIVKNNATAHPMLILSVLVNLRSVGRVKRRK